MKIASIVAFVFLVIVFGPIVTIWSLNTLFPALAIPYSFQTWMAVIILGGVLGGAKASGMGVEMGEEGLNEFTQLQVVNIAKAPKAAA